MSTSHPKILLDPSIFLQTAITVTNAESPKSVHLAYNQSLFERLEELALNHELFISSNFMNMFLKITDELKQIKGNAAFYIPIYVLWRLFGTPLGIRGTSSPQDDDPARYTAICDPQDTNAQTFIDIADKIRTIFKGKKIKQYTFRFNIGRGHQTAGPALVKVIDAIYQPALKIKNSKDSGECNPEKIEKIFEDMLDFVELDGPLLAENKQTFELLQGAGVPVSTERKTNPDLVDRDRSFLKDKFKGVKSRGFKYLISKLKLAKLILLDMKDPLLT
jgi:hypothetical protein